MHRSTVALAIAVTLRLASPVSAQPLPSHPPATHADFSRIRLKVGDLVFVTDPERNVEVSGRLTSLSPDELSVDGYHFTPKPGLKIERTGDDLWNGVATGFLLGGLAGVTIGAEGCLHGSHAPCFFSGGMVWGAIGAYVDWRHKGRTTVFLGGPTATQTTASASGAESPARLTVFDFSALGLKLGDRVAITAGDGTQTTGAITTMNHGTFRVGAVDLSATSPILVERIGDPIWDGAAYGVGLAAMIGVAAQTGARSAATTAVIFGSIGAIIDACVKGRTSVYGDTDPLGRSSVRLVPEIGPHSKGAALVVRF